jgi:hypothetical protein
MGRIRAAVVALLLLSMSGCASYMAFERRFNHEGVMESWMGSDINDLTRAWGRYSEKDRLSDGSPTYTWVWERRLPDGSDAECSTTMITDRRGRITHANSYGVCRGMGLAKGPGNRGGSSGGGKMAN